MSLIHKFVSGAAASGNPALVDGPKHNDPHIATGGATGLVMTRDTTLDPPTGEGWTWAPVFAAGTRMVFDQDTAPVGWTRDVTITDRVIRIVNGARADGGSWTVSGFTLATANLPNHTHTLGNHTHAIAHTHTITHDHGGGNTNPGRHRIDVTVSNDTAISESTDLSTNASSAASSGAPSTNTSGATGSGTPFGNNGTWRPLHRDFILCQKD